MPAQQSKFVTQYYLLLAVELKEGATAAVHRGLLGIVVVRVHSARARALRARRDHVIRSRRSHAAYINRFTPRIVDRRASY
eukprot:COSAG01_NODE_39135_length_480_cov_2.278215_1_plen_80_part_10